MTDQQTYLGYKTSKAADHQRWEHRREVRDALEWCAEAVAIDEYDTVRALLRDVLFPLLLGEDGEQISHYHQYLGGVGDFDVFALTRAIGADTIPVETVEAAVDSCGAIAEHEGIVQSDVMQPRAAWEYEHQVGNRYYSPDSSIAPEVELIDPDGELKATLMTGGQGSGKSTAVKTLLEDRIDHGHTVIDLVDFHKAENATPDIPQRQENLREIRASMGLDIGFDGFDPPNVEIIAPLSHALADAKVPTDLERDEPTVTAFAIPASDLTYRQLVMLLPHTTPTQENYLQSAYQELERSGKDWTLAELATAVREDTNANDAVADRIEQSLRRTQQKPYIRDTESDLTLDWERLMSAERHYSAFTVHMLREKSEKLAVTSYLLDQLYEERNRLHRERRLQEFPPMTAVFRELHTITPRGQSEQDNENTLERYMTDTFRELIALMRHVKMEIVADTQKFYRQLHPEVGGLFHRIFAFSGHKPDIEHVFRTRVGDTGPAEKVAGYEVGRCAMVSGDGYKMPIEWAPPRSHHPDAKKGEDGFSMRVESDAVPDEWAPAPWDSAIPKRLRFDDVPDSPITRFYEQFIRTTGERSDYELKRDITDAYNAWARTNGNETYRHAEVHRWFNQHTDLEDGQKSLDEGRKAVWWGAEIVNDPRHSEPDTGTAGGVADD